MKKQLCTIFATAVILAMQPQTGKAQTVATFENLTLKPDTFWNGSTQSFGASFRSGHALFTNYYDTAYGGYWSGWAYSDMKDSTTAGYTNEYSSRSASGYNGSANYAVAYTGGGSVMSYIDSNALGKAVSGFYINNGTYPALSMKYGDSFAKKFGDTTGTNCHCPQGTYPDWFKLTVQGWLAGKLSTDSVVFYLADYRFGTDTAKDYIVSKWQWVDLTPLGNIDSLQYTLYSSDNGAFGMNTPAYFCVDNFTTADSPAGIMNINNANSSIQVYPNPAMDVVNIDLSNVADRNVILSLTDVAGQIIHTENIASHSIVTIDMNGYAKGVYFINIKGASTFINKKIVKE